MASGMLRAVCMAGVVLLGAGIAILVPSDTRADGQAPAAPPSPGVAAPNAPAAPVRRILPDGTIEVREPDGTVRREKAEDAAQQSLLPDLVQAAGMDPVTHGRYQEALRAYYSYRLEGYVHRQRTFAWQLFSSRVIFWAVLALVVSGIYFAAVQFHVGLRRGGSAAQQPSVATLIEASPGGIKVSSPVLGVLILVISLAFFYLYLVFVYPIHEIF